jgi:LysM repeat protein
MKRPSVLIGAFAVLGMMLLLPAGAFAQPESPAQQEIPPGGIVHTVVEGDTLWDLAAKHLGSPWKWKEIWELNRFVTNPHYIYPGIRIVIVPSGPREAALIVEPPPEQPAPAAAAAEPAAPPAPAPPAPREDYLGITADDMVRAGQFLKEKPKGIGKILGGKDPRVGFSTDDTVYLSLDRTIPVGQVLAVYRVRGPVRVPGGRVRSGYVKYLIGVLQTGPAEDGKITARVRDAFEDLTRDDLVSEEIPAYARVRIVPGREGLEATVIANRLINQEMATGDFVFLDKGSASGVEVGNVFRVVKPIDVEAGAAISGRSKGKIDVASVVVVRADRDFSTAFVNYSSQSFEAGVKARRGIPAK